MGAEAVMKDVISRSGDDCVHDVFPTGGKQYLVGVSVKGCLYSAEGQRSRMYVDYMYVHIFVVSKHDELYPRRCTIRRGASSAVVFAGGARVHSLWG